MHPYLLPSISSGASLLLAALLSAPLSVQPAPARVFAMTNEVAANRVVVYERHAQGGLTLVDSVLTGGTGTGLDLGSQGALALSDDRRWLLAVNPGSDELSVLGIAHDGVRLSDVVPIRGQMPLSVAIDGDLVYVLLGGVPNKVLGFRLSEDGELDVIPDSARALSGSDVGPAQVEFSPSGDLLVVTEKMTSRIDVFAVGADGLLSDFHSLPSSGVTPFGFAFRRDGVLIVSEAFMGAPDASAVSSYDLLDPATLVVVSASVPTTETAACWIALPVNQRFAYTTNTGSDSISGFEIGPDGELTRLDADGVTAVTGDNPVDLTFSRNGRFLYALNAHAGTISIFERLADGSLDAMGVVGGLPTLGAAGLVGY